MASPANRKPVMTLYSGTTDPYSHRTRIVLFEKDVECQIVFVEPDNKPAALADLNPYNQVPTMVDRDLVLYQSSIINEYLDERLPHPPLMPVDPVNRSRGDKKLATKARHAIRDGLTVISPVFKEQPFVLGEEFSLVDCALAPILWRLEKYKISLPRQAAPIMEYANRLFERKSFQLSLTELEREMVK